MSGSIRKLDFPSPLNTQPTTKDISLGKVGFVFSVAFLAFLCDFLSRANRWPPTAFLQQVQQEASSAWYHPSLTTRIYDRKGVRIEQPDGMQPGLTFINSYWKYADGWSPAFKLVDCWGESVHSWRIDREALFPEAIDRRGDPDEKNVQDLFYSQKGIWS